MTDKFEILLLEFRHGLSIAALRRLIEIMRQQQKEIDELKKCVEEAKKHERKDKTTGGVKYSLKWRVKCPVCSNSVVLERPEDKPHVPPSTTCASCQSLISGLIYGDEYRGWTAYILDLSMNTQP